MLIKNFNPGADLSDLVIGVYNTDVAILAAYTERHLNAAANAKDSPTTVVCIDLRMKPPWVCGVIKSR